MFPYDEENLEHKIRDLGKNLRSSELLEVATAKRVLRNGLQGFEKLLKKLPPNERQAALRLYLDRIKYVTFLFNLSVLKMSIKAECSNLSSREELQEKLRRGQNEFNDLARLYEML